MCNVIKKRCVFFLLSNTYFPTDKLPQAAGGTAKKPHLAYLLKK